MGILQALEIGEYAHHAAGVVPVEVGATRLPPAVRGAAEDERHDEYVALLEENLRRAIAPGRVRLRREPSDILTPAQLVAHRLTNCARAFAMHDPRFRHACQRRVLKIVLQSLECFVASQSAQVQLEWDVTPRRRKRQTWDALRLRRATLR